jgi:hypothetical protein
MTVFTIPDDAVTVKAIATDNLVSGNRARYPLSELPALVKFLPGKPATLDHDWFDCTDEWGIITSASLLKTEPPPDLDAEDQAIVKAEGYYQVIVEISCPPDTPYLGDFQYGIRIRVSIAATYSQMRCPGCKCGEDVFSRECVNDFWTLPYYERIGVMDALEISLVSVPAVKAAQVLLSEVSDG